MREGKEEEGWCCIVTVPSNNLDTVIRLKVLRRFTNDVTYKQAAFRCNWRMLTPNHILIDICHYFAVSLTIKIEKFPVVIQQYEAEADNEYVIRGNSAIMKCEIPSYVSDFIVVDMWADSDGGSYYPNNDNYGTFHSRSISFRF